MPSACPGWRASGRASCLDASRTPSSKLSNRRIPVLLNLLCGETELRYRKKYNALRAGFAAGRATYAAAVRPAGPRAARALILPPAAAAAAAEDEPAYCGADVDDDDDAAPPAPAEEEEAAGADETPRKRRRFEDAVARLGSAARSLGAVIDLQTATDLVVRAAVQLERDVEVQTSAAAAALRAAGAGALAPPPDAPAYNGRLRFLAAGDTRRGVRPGPPQEPRGAPPSAAANPAVALPCGIAKRAPKKKKKAPAVVTPEVAAQRAGAAAVLAALER